MDSLREDIKLILRNQVRIMSGLSVLKVGVLRSDDLLMQINACEERIAEMSKALVAPPEMPQFTTDARDARRYRRLQVLGCAPYGSKQLAQGTVLRFTGLDDIVDADIAVHQSRGDASPPPTPAIADRLVDWTYLHATEGEQWPSPGTRAKLIANAMVRQPNQDDADEMKRK